MSRGQRGGRRGWRGSPSPRCRRRPSAPRSPFEAHLGQAERVGRGRQKIPSRPAERRQSPPQLPLDVRTASRPSRILALAFCRSAGPRERVRPRPHRGSRGRAGRPCRWATPGAGCAWQRPPGWTAEPVDRGSLSPALSHQDDQAKAPSGWWPDPAKCPGPSHSPSMPSLRWMLPGLAALC